MPKIRQDEFIQCVMCKRLVSRAEISFLRVRVSPKQVVRVPVCHLCQVDPNKIRYYIAQQQRGKRHEEMPSMPRPRS